MPNLITKTIIKPQLPFSGGRCDFLWEVNSDNSDYILTRCTEEEFFIQIKGKEPRIIVKGEKISRPSQVIFLQNALEEYAKKASCDIIASNIIPASNRQKERNSIIKEIDFFAQNFAFEKELFLEIGFGSGRHLLYQAKNNPNKLIIGIEIHKPSIEQVAKQCDILGLKNVILINYDSRILMEFLRSNSISKIFIHFPVPWDKKPHRRVISPYFVNEALRILTVGGTLELRTDSHMYYAYALDIFMQNTYANVRIFKNFDLKISSKYEDRWKRLEKNIYDIVLTNTQLYPENSPLAKLSFDYLNNIDKIIRDFIPKLFRGDDFFVHFEEIHTGCKKAVIKVAFGAYERAEHLFIIVEENKISYFPNGAYAVKANKKAHEIIKKWLYGW
ncbi:MAG: tRNA (guanosine(46)-N7)-methyltransferase TrmB [Campylobacteraceae bacterium]|jgi:tRNA (guanine-N7-)-methyltransferase|nr:tRNA (guanosine(46)-N7)-methyltransferase TrmB [Campylobacteraceae bacterium]